MTVDGSPAPIALGLPRRRSLTVNSAGLVVGKVAQMGTGFLFWLVAAHTATVRDVGVAAAAVSAVMLCTQVGLLGSGAAVIVLVGRGRDRVVDVLDAAVGVVAVAAAGAAMLSVAVIAGFSGDLGRVIGAGAFPAVFVIAAVFGTVIITLDQAWIALARGDQVVPRYVVSGTLAIVLLALVGSRSAQVTAAAILACWTVDAVVSAAIGAWQARRWFGTWIRPRYEPRLTRSMIRLGLPNQALTLTERGPALLIPVLTAQLVSPTTTAGWYPAWMMVWVAYTAPVAVGLAQFSEVVRRPEQMRETTWKSLRWSVVLGGAIAAALAVLAEPLLSLLGHTYAESSTTALRILALGVLPYAVMQAYNAVCRSLGRLVEATIAGLILALAACSATVAAARHGATAMAVAWVGMSTLGAVWCGVRLVALTRREGSPP
jgi:O-antigen/teichoic acid export membrane protein